MRTRLALIFVLLICAASAHGAIRYVPSQNYPTIQSAVDASSSGDQVIVFPGTYSDVTHQAGVDDTTKCVVVMKSGITLTGAGMGATIIDCQRRGRGIQCTGVTNATIQGLTIKHAYAAVHGAGIFCFQGSSPTINHCELTQNYDGGIILFMNCSPTITGCLMTSNINKLGGGLEINDNCSPLVTGCIITGNSAPAGGGVMIRVHNSAPTVTGCIINSNWINTQAGGGGGIEIDNASPHIDHCQIAYNQAGTVGGGIYCGQSNLDLTNCLVLSNILSSTAAYGAGVCVDDGSTATLNGCTIARNFLQSADSLTDGAGVAAYFSNQLTMSQCTVAANSCPLGFGGGIAVKGTPTTIEKSILAYNAPGAAMYCYPQFPGMPTVSCTDLYGNQAGNNICGTDAGHNFHLDPRFCDWNSNDFRLQTTSPCAPGHHPDGPNICDGSRLGSEDTGCSPAEVEEPAAGGPAARFLYNVPNPFHGATTIQYALGQAGWASLRIFDVAGRQVRNLTTGPVGAGTHRIAWDGTDDAGNAVPAGIYLCRLATGGPAQVHHLVLTR